MPKAVPVECTGSASAKAAFGTRLFWATPRLPALLALLALDLAVAAAGAIVFVNTVILVRDHFHKSAGAVSLTLGAYGAGSMLTALLLPRLLRRVSDRRIMLPAAFALPLALAAVAALTATAPRAWSWPALLVAWAAIGAACSAVLTSGRARHPPFHLRPGPARRLRRPVLPLPQLLAADLPPRRLARRRSGPAGDRGRAGDDRADRSDHGSLRLARLGPRRTAAHPRRSGPGHPHLADARPSGGGWQHGHHYVIDQHHHRRPAPAASATSMDGPVNA